MFAFANDGGSISALHNPRLIISEVYANTDLDGSSLEAFEWIEIHNPERYPVNLSGWTIEDAQAIARLPDVAIPAGRAAVIVGGSADIVVPPDGALIILDSPKIGSGLRNAGDRVALVNPHGIRHDAVSWGDVRWPRSGEVPNPRQSIIRTSANGQVLTDELTPWTVGEAINAKPEQYRHPRPDTSVRIVRALVNPLDGGTESITIRNISDQPLLTVNWTLTVGNSLVRLRSARIEPGSEFVVTESDGEIGAGLPASGGHLVLRDRRGNWLSTASWGDDRSFHDLPTPQPAQEVHFNPLKRVHPRIPWFESYDVLGGRLVGDAADPRSTSGRNVSTSVRRERLSPVVQQESEPATVWISEVYPTAGQGRNDAAFEWFELTNSSDTAVALDGWSIADNTSSDSLDGLSIPAQASIVISTSAAAGPDAVIAITDGRIGNGLANAGDQLRLLTPEGDIASAMSWGNDRTYASVKAPTSDESIHRPSPVAQPSVGRPSAGTVTPDLRANDAFDAFELASQSEAGKPGAGVTPADSPSTSFDAEPARQSLVASVRSSAPPMLTITEILPAPLAGQAEWVEIHNPSDHPVDLSGWTIGDADRRTELSGIIPPRSRFVVSTEELQRGTAGLVVARIGNGLNNDADTITVFAPDGSPADQVQYGGDALPAPGRGLSIALEPDRWVVTAQPTPGSAEVKPLLDDAFKSASEKPPISDEGRLPLVPSTPEQGANAWMIVSFALIGVILTLVIRRWQPAEEATESNPEPEGYSVPTPAPSSSDELERRDEPQDQ